MRQLTPCIWGLIFLTTSCGQTTQTNKPIISDSTHTKADSITTPTFPPPVDIKSIKQLPFLSITSGISLTADTNYCRPDTNGFFGGYFLINKQKKGTPIIGELAVFTTDTPQNWKYDNNNETFLEIKLQSADIKVWDSIGVGTNEKEVLKFIGTNFHYKKGTLLYCELDDYSASFTILSDTVNKLTVGKYCKDKK